ncbi:MAG: hypothetical protein NTX92_03505, partial [Euryarchaeota archaeon]|nr:hypothetical protein [Euryarchaeota archaeon]
MNPFLNPVSGIPLLKNYLFDTRRLNTNSPEKIRKSQNKALLRTLRYADTVPLYHKKYAAAGLCLQDIHGIEDITKIPLVSKQDLVDHFPNDILPPNYKRQNAHLVSTSGSTGKQVSIYTDLSIF